MTHPVHIIYVTLKGKVGYHIIEDSITTDRYLQGFTPLGYRTFRLDRIVHVVESGDDIDELLQHHENHELPVKTAPRKKMLEVCFTGFKAKLKKELIELAEQSKMHVAKSVTVDLDFLCVFGNLTPANTKLNKKLIKARKQGALLINENEFIHLIETGEIPDG